MKKCRYYLEDGERVVPEIRIPLDPTHDIRVRNDGIECYNDSGCGWFGSVEQVVDSGNVDPDDKHLIEALRHLLLWVRGE